MQFNELTEAQKAKFRACETPEKLMALAREQGIELSDEQLEVVAGGKNWNSSVSSDECPAHCVFM